ncbi:Uu.00g029270.m01.CDS01 [Anthostomella pinea]|uniref:Uu.00g029270.m01.CDS01 n=1 Tax=Anthostomella pinea TaxID=933095 RepID=A0AAI8V827_9PEZI|nr:Uu.00g029270.m01.CDS01 [Anthostomella pinea]
MGGNVWFISGASSGFGKHIAQEALSRGDAVIATSRKGTTLKDLEAAGALLLDLDVTSDDATIQVAFQAAGDKHGAITHFVNAAGYILTGAIEAISAQEAFDSFNNNVLGVMNMSRNQVAYLRPRRAGGVIANFGSVGSWYGGAAFAHYAAAKWAVSGFTESLHEEVKEFGIRATVIEPGYFRTGFLNEGGGNCRSPRNEMRDEYTGTGVAGVMDFLGQANRNQPGDVVKAARIIVDVLTGTGVAAGKEFPIRLLLGPDCVRDVKAKMARTEALIREWEPTITSTDHEDVKKA